MGSPSFRPSLPQGAGYIVKIYLPLNGEVKIPIQTLVTRMVSPFFCLSCPLSKFVLTFKIFIIACLCVYVVCMCVCRDQRTTLENLFSLHYIGM